MLLSDGTTLPSRIAVDIATWLRGLGLERYEPIFRENEIDWEVLPELSEAEFEKIGLPLGPRKKLLKAIAALGTDQTNAGEAFAAAPREAERRQLTVMFVDLVGSTALGGKLDPEDEREVIRGYQNAVAGEIARFEGHVAKFMGDGVLAYFGWPQAHEDEAERAVRAGLATVEAIERLSAPNGTALACRIGIATGLVVVGDLVGEGAAQEEAVVGETPNLAARLQALAEPGTVVIAQTTSQLVRGLFQLQDLGSHELKGFAQSIRAWQVVGSARPKAASRRGTWRSSRRSWVASTRSRYCAIVGRGRSGARVRSCCFPAKPASASPVSPGA
jgi:class 3 adenylate cyclase